MTIEYIIRQNDYLQLNLYGIKKDNLLKKHILKNWISWFVILLVLVVISYLSRYIELLISISIGAIIGLIIHPFRLKRLYFERMLKATTKYQSRFNSLYKLIINNDFIELITITGEHKMKISEVESFIETKHHFFISLKPDVIIIPKSELENLDIIRDELKKISEKLNVKYLSDINWKW